MELFPAVWFMWQPARLAGLNPLKFLGRLQIIQTARLPSARQIQIYQSARALLSLFMEVPATIIMFPQIQIPTLSRQP